jgi:hypothetical protein
MPFLLGLIRIIPATISAFALFFIGAGAVWFWDRRETQVPSFHYKLLFWKVGWTAPKSLAQQLAEMKALQAKADRQARTIQTNQQSASAAISERQVVVQERIRWRVKETTREVPIYLSADADRRYPMPNGLVRLHDAAARGVAPDAIPYAPGEPNDAPSGIAASDFGRTVVGNYEAVCRANAEQLAGLQEWIAAMQAASATPSN